MSEPDSKRESKRHAKKPREEEDFSLLPKSQNSSNKTLSNMITPSVDLKPTNRVAHSEKYPPNDLEVMDPRLKQ